MNLATLRKLVWGYVFVIPVLIVLTVIQFASVQGVVNAFRVEGNSIEIIRHAEARSIRNSAAVANFQVASAGAKGA